MISSLYQVNLTTLFQETDIFPLKPVTFLEQDMFLPRHPVATLETMYGANAVQTCVSNHLDHKLVEYHGTVETDCINLKDAFHWVNESRLIKNSTDA